LIDANTLGGLLGRPTSVDVPGVIGGLGSILAGKIEIGIGILLGPTTGVGLFGIGAGINDIYQGSRAVYDALYVNGKSSTVLQVGSNLVPGPPGLGTMLQGADKLIMQTGR